MSRHPGCTPYSSAKRLMRDVEKEDEEEGDESGEQ